MSSKSDPTDMLQLLENLRIASTPGGIEAQETAGQATFCLQEILPKELRDVTREQLEALGVVFGTDHDDIFVNATLPPGWTKKATDHAMWSHLLDAYGRRRASIFYKAAFYDRSASLSMDCRYSVSAYEKGSEAEHGAVWILDGGTKRYHFGDYPEDDRKAKDTLVERALAWLSKTFPEHGDWSAHWD